MLADMQGVSRTLEWYVDQAEGGDRDAALRAIDGVLRSMKPAALAQNGGAPPPPVLAALIRILGPATVTGDSKVLRAARKAPNPDVEKRARMWWWCVAIHQRLQAQPDESHVDAAAAVLADEPTGDKIPDAASVAKRYQQWRPLVEQFLLDEQEP